MPQSLCSPLNLNTQTNSVILSHHLSPPISLSTLKSLPLSYIPSLHDSLIENFSYSLPVLPQSLLTYLFASVFPRSSTLLSKNYQRPPTPTLSYTKESSSFVCFHFLYGWQLLPFRQLCQADPSIISKDSSHADMTVHQITTPIL